MNNEKAEKISDAITQIDEDLVAEADEKRKDSDIEILETTKTAEKEKPKKRRSWIPIASLAACAAIICGVALYAGLGNNNVPAKNETGSGNAGGYENNFDAMPEMADNETEGIMGTTAAAEATEGRDNGLMDTAVSPNEYPDENPSAGNALEADVIHEGSEYEEVYTETNDEAPAEAPMDTEALEMPYGGNIAKAIYPEKAYNPHAVYDGGEIDEDFDAAWDRYREHLQAMKENKAQIDDDNLLHFCTLTSKELLSGDNNSVYSPLNIYMALALLSETTEGESREQILELAGMDNINDLRAQAGNIWLANYNDSGAQASILANSIWLSDKYRFKEQTLNLLAEKYYTSSYQGTMGSEGMNQMLRDWLNEQTQGLLENYVEGASLPDDSVMSLCSTVYFYAAWSDKFLPENNDERVFHTPSGDITTEFMNGSNFAGTYYWGDDYGAIRLPFDTMDGGGMWLVLPEEGKSIDDVMASGEYLKNIDAQEYALSEYTDSEYGNSRYAILNYSVPKFDISAETDLSVSLARLGVTDVFDSAQADFSPLTDEAEGMYLTSATHAARVKIDEEGCTAAAYTQYVGGMGGPEPPDEEIDFVLDRPFIFVITGATGNMLFIGTVNNPIA